MKIIGVVLSILPVLAGSSCCRFASSGKMMPGAKGDYVSVWTAEGGIEPGRKAMKKSLTILEAEMDKRVAGYYVYGAAGQRKKGSLRVRFLPGQGRDEHGAVVKGNVLEVEGKGCLNYDRLNADLPGLEKDVAASIGMEAKKRVLKKTWKYSDLAREMQN